jgi:hypothetical protein
MAALAGAAIAAIATAAIAICCSRLSIPLLQTSNWPPLTLVLWRTVPA